MSGFFTKNEGNADRAIRVVLGLGLLSLPVVSEASWAWAGLVGLVPLVTGLAGTCPIYSMLGISTCPIETKAG